MARRTVNNIISVFYSFIRLCLLKISHPQGLKFYCIERISPNVVIELNRNGSLIFGKKVRIHSGCKMKVRNGAVMKIDDGVRINYNCIFAAHKGIYIGKGTEFGPNVLIYDHDHDYRSGLKNEKFLSDAVEIGKNCWIGARVTILKGVHIGDGCVVAAGSVITQDIPSESVVYQKRDTRVIRDSVK